MLEFWVSAFFLCLSCWWCFRQTLLPSPDWSYFNLQLQLYILPNVHERSLNLSGVYTFLIEFQALTVTWPSITNVLACNRNVPVARSSLYMLVILYYVQYCWGNGLVNKARIYAWHHVCVTLCTRPFSCLSVYDTEKLWECPGRNVNIHSIM